MSNFPEAKKHEYCKTALSMEADARLLYLKLGERLYNIRQERLYEPAWSDWHEFCMEFRDLSIASISKMIAVYETFILKHGYKPQELAKAGGWSKLYELTVHIKSKKDAEHWLGLAESQPRGALREFLLEAKTGVDIRDCKHKKTYTIEVCEDCGRRVLTEKK